MTTKSDELRGFTIELGGKEWRLRPNFRAASEIQERRGGLARVFERMLGEFHTVDIVTVLWGGIVAELGMKDAPTLDEIGDWIHEEGPSEYLKPAVRFLKLLLKSGDSAKPNGQAEDAGEGDPLDASLSAISSPSP